jgi:hypothetical protein
MSKIFGVDFTMSNVSPKCLPSLDSWMALLKKVGSIGPLTFLFLVKSIFTLLLGVAGVSEEHITSVFRVE